MQIIKSTKIISPEYIAGVFDSDGSITIARRHLGTRKQASYCPCLQLQWKYSPLAAQVMQEIKERYGGSICLPAISAGSLGKNQTIKYTVASKMSKTLLTDIIPYLRLKKQQAELALKLVLINTDRFYAGRGAGRPDIAFCHNIWEEVKILNKGIK